MHSQGMRARVRDLYFVQGMGMRTIGAMPGMPTRRTVRLWVCADPVTVRLRGDTGCRIRWRPDWGRARVRADRSPLPHRRAAYRRACSRGPTLISRKAALDWPWDGTKTRCFASMFVRQVRQCFSAVWADGFPRCRHRFPVM